MLQDNIGRDPNGEDADLKSVGRKNFAGSTPVSSANDTVMDILTFYHTYFIIPWCEGSRREITLPLCGYGVVATQEFSKLLSSVQIRVSALAPKGNQTNFLV